MIDVPNGVEMVNLDEFEVKNIWDRVKDFDKMFCDGTRGNYKEFKRKLLDPNVIVLRVENGILILKNMVDNLCSEAHIQFWDKKLSIHANVCKDCLMWAFLQFGLERIETFVPSVSKAVRRFITKRLNFREEGVMRNKIRWNGMLVDMHFYSILKNEVLQ